MKEIQLSNGGVSLVDDDDFDFVNRHRWHRKDSHGNSYAKGCVNGASTYIHRLLISAQPGQEVDHRNGNGLDNRRSNLRIASVSQNHTNTNARGLSGLKGVYKTWRINRDGKKQWASRWSAKIGVNGEHIFLGTHATKEEAALAYDAAALKFYGEFARTNFATTN